MADEHRLVVRRARLTHEGISFDDGGMLAVELDEPRERFLVVHEWADDVQVLSVHETKSSAIHAAQRVEAELKRLNQQVEGAALQ